MVGFKDFKYPPVTITAGIINPNLKWYFKLIVGV